VLIGRCVRLLKDEGVVVYHRRDRRKRWTWLNNSTRLIRYVCRRSLYFVVFFPCKNPTRRCFTNFLASSWINLFVVEGNECVMQWLPCSINEHFKFAAVFRFSPTVEKLQDAVPLVPEVDVGLQSHVIGSPPAAADLIEHCLVGKYVVFF
jgi:hypothetical protein